MTDTETRPHFIIAPATPKDLETVRALFREYQAFLQVDLCFQDFEEELRNLPGCYADPDGTILIARDAAGSVAGVVALRPAKGMAAEAGRGCEMKRLWVRQDWRGTGLGNRLAQAIMEDARQRGYTLMVLDTLDRLRQAVGLYRKLGFQERTAYYDNPLPGVIYMECRL